MVIVFIVIRHRHRRQDLLLLRWSWLLLRRTGSTMEARHILLKSTQEEQYNLYIRNPTYLHKADFKIENIFKIK